MIFPQLIPRAASHDQSDTVHRLKRRLSGQPPADVVVRRIETLSRSIVRGTSNVKNVASTDFVIQWRLKNEAGGEEPRLS